MSKPVTLVAWENATKKPPEEGEARWTDVGLRTYMDWRVFDHPEDDEDDGMLVRDWWQSDGMGSVEIADPRPSVWCDPAPPGPDALTVEDLRGALWAAEDHFAIFDDERERDVEDGVAFQGVGYADVEKTRAQVARLRAALDALGNGGTE